MTTVYTRKLSMNERTFLALDRFGAMNSQFVFEGNDIDITQLREAVQIASEANPGSRLVLRGSLRWCRWVDSGVSPPVREVDGSKWDGTGPAGAPFLNERLDFRNGPTCEVLVVRGHPLPEGNKVRIIFRTNHGVMDGRGTFVWIKDVFRVLNGQKPIGSTSSLTDTELALSVQKKTRQPLPPVFLSPTGRAEGRETGTIWSHRFIKAGKIPGLLGRLSVLIAEEAWRHADGEVLIAIPVDMRRHRPDLNSTANLTYSIYVPVKRGDTPEKVTAEIKRQLNENCECMLTPSDELLHFVPLCLIARQARKIMDERHRRGLYGMSAVVSNMGQDSLENYRGGGFETRSIWAIPPALEYFPCFIGIMHNGGTLHIMTTMPRVLATRNRLEILMDRIVSELKP